MNTLLKKGFLFFLLSISFCAFSQEDGSLDIDELKVQLSSNYDYVLNNKDLYDIGCDQIIVLKGYTGEAFLGGYRGIKYFYNEWIIYRNQLAIDTIIKPMYKPAKGWWYQDDVFFNIFPYAGTYTLKLNVRAYVTGYLEDDWVIQTAESNLITIYDDFLPHLIGGTQNENKIHEYNTPKSIVLDCSGASCILEYFIIVTEYDENWEEVGRVVEKIYRGNPEDFIDLFVLAKREKYNFKPGTNYKVMVGPGSNILIDPNTWYTNEAFRVKGE